jgi:hypothetical protein
MELRVHLKVCEACGCLWFRAQAATSVYCSTCHERFKDFPTPQTRRRRGRPKKTTLPAVFAVEASHQSLAEGVFKAVAEFGAASEVDREPPVISLLAAQGSFASGIAGVL